MFSWLPKRFKKSIKGWLKNVRLNYVRKWYAFSSEDLLTYLRRLGVQKGDVLFVHSAFDRFEGFTGKATDVIHVLQDAVGEDGTLLMPTLPFNGSAIKYVSQGKTFDVKKTPSRMGIIKELFRRSPGVLRSVHPTHSVVAWNANAKEMIADHHLAGTPCGRKTPYGRLLDYHGKILFLGKDIGVITFFHTVEEILEPKMPFSPFTKEKFSLSSKDQNGNILKTNMRLFESKHSRRRNLDKLIPVLKKKGCWREGRIGKLNGILLKAEDVLKTSQDLADQGEYCYGP